MYIETHTHLVCVCVCECVSVCVCVGIGTDKASCVVVLPFVCVDNVHTCVATGQQQRRLRSMRAGMYTLFDRFAKMHNV